MTVKLVVIFNASNFEYRRRGTDSEIHPAGEDLARFIYFELTELGAEPLLAPIQTIDGWEEKIKIGNTTFNLFVHWVPIGEPIRDFWSIQFGIKNQSRRDLKPEQVAPLSNYLKRIFDKFSDDFLNIQWLTLEEFDAIY